MTIEELWNNLKPILEKQEDDIKEIKEQIKDIPDMKEQIYEMKERICEIKEQIKIIPEIKEQIHIIKNINLTAIINNQTKLFEKLDVYEKQNELEHKKFEYKIAN